MKSTAKKLLFVSSIDFSRNGATQAHQLLIMTELVRNGYRIQLVNLQHTPVLTEYFSVISLPMRYKYLPWRISIIFFLSKTLVLNLRSFDALFLFGYDPLILLPAIILGKIFKKSIFHEFTEYPDTGMVNNFYSRLSKYLFESISLKAFDGVVVISHALSRYVQEISPSQNIFIMPAIAAEMNEIGPIMESSVVIDKGDNFLFLYVGSSSENKDGVISLVKSFCRISAKWPNTKLLLACYGGQAQKSVILNAINEQGMNDRVILFGEIPRKHIASLLSQGDGLVLCRPNSRQAQGGFPTKLVEYLSTGKPVIVTDTSDIRLYLEDRVSAFITPPGDIVTFASAMDELLSNRKTAMQIGDAGLKVFKKYFDAKVAVHRLACWLNNQLSN